MDELFNDWKKRDVHKDSLFISDGVNNDELWKESDFRILFLLKEAYDSKRTTGSWHLPNYIKKRKAAGRTFKPLGQWAYGIQKIKSTGNIEDFLDHGKEIHDALMSSAVVNIKKSQGKKRSSDGDLMKYIKSDWDLLEQQITILNPNIIVCGKTFHLIKKQLKGAIKISDRIYRYNDFIFVDFWHPANRASNLMNYYALNALVYKYMKKTITKKSS
mgnify:CR=1 FL=1